MCLEKVATTRNIYIYIKPQSKPLKAILESHTLNMEQHSIALTAKSKGKRLTTRGLRQIIQNLFDELGIEKTVHGSRHFFTTGLIRHYRSDLTTVARFTRHNSLEMLTDYNDEIASENDTELLSKAFQYGL